MMLRSQGLALILAFASTLSARADTPRVPPEFTANYAVSYRGIQAGNLTFALQRAEDGRYIYETKADPSFLARLVVSSNAVERSEMIIDENGVRALEWSLDDRSEERRVGKEGRTRRAAPSSKTRTRSDAS